MYSLSTSKPRAVYKNRQYKSNESIIIKGEIPSHGNKGWDGVEKDKSEITKIENRVKGGYYLINQITPNFMEAKVKRKI